MHKQHQFRYLPVLFGAVSLALAGVTSLPANAGGNLKCQAYAQAAIAQRGKT